MTNSTSGWLAVGNRGVCFLTRFPGRLKKPVEQDFRVCGARERARGRAFVASSTDAAGAQSPLLYSSDGDRFVVIIGNSHCTTCRSRINRHLRRIRVVVVVVITCLLPNLAISKLVDGLAIPSVEGTIDLGLYDWITSAHVFLLFQEKKRVASEPTIKLLPLRLRKGGNPCAFQFVGCHKMINRKRLLRLYHR